MEPAETRSEKSAPPLPKAGQYYLLEKIAQGGMAEIFKGLAYDLAGIKKNVCIKKILPQIAASKEFIDMLVDEAKIAVKLSQGNIAQVYDLGKAGDDYFIVMEYVDGQSLSKIQKKLGRLQKQMPVPIACTIIAEIASGLDYMHRKTDEEGGHLHIVHRDISPQNIVVSYSGTVKIIDFGIAKAAVKIGHTESGILKGKFAYMSPEQARGDSLDHRSDLFSLGVIFHELLTGKRLFKGKENKETLRNVRRAKIIPPSKIIPEIPNDLDTIVLKMLEKNRKDRYAFASDLKEELLRFLHTFYPDFKSAHVADFIRDLFKEEALLTQKLSEIEVKTPHLILEATRTKSDEEEATHGGIKEFDIREFMIDEEWPGEPETRDQKLETGEEMEKKEEGTAKTHASLSFQLQTFLISLGTLLILGGAGYWLWWKKAPPKEPPLTIQPLNIPPSFATPKPASISVESNPLGALIYLNDEETGFKTPSRLENLPFNQLQTLGLYLENYKFYKTEFKLKKEETQNFYIELAVNYGTVKVMSQPSGGQVWINGELAGVTPLQKDSLEPKTILKIEIQSEGYAPFLQEIKVESGKEHVVNAILERSRGPQQE